MKQIFDFSRQAPPPLSERELRRRLERRSQQRWAAALAVAGALLQLALLLLALGLATVSPALGLAALAYAAQMLAGSARMVLETGAHPGALKDAVCSPGGSTLQGVRALEKGGLRAAAMDAVLAAYEKTQELGKK